MKGKRKQDSKAAEDTQAILSRRRFLIQTALAGAGIGVAASAGCRPRVCLSPAVCRPA